MSTSADALIKTRIDNVYVESPGLWKNEFRRGMYGAMDFYLQQTALPTGVASAALRAATHGSVDDAYTSSNRSTVKIPIYKKTSATISTSRSCDIPNNEVPSDLQTIAFSSIADGFWMFPNRYVNNIESYENHWRVNFEAMMQRIWAKINALCVANLEAFKNTVTPANAMGYTWNSNSVRAAFNEREEFLADLTSIQHSDNYYGTMNIIGNSGVENIFTHLYEHGVYNDVNRAVEYADKRLFISDGISNDTNKYATGYIIPDGNVGILSRVSRAEFANSRGPVSTWGTTRLPGCGELLFGTHYKTVEGDMAAVMNGNGTFNNSETSVNDMTCDVAEQYGFSIDLAFVNAYNSDTSNVQSPCLKFDISTGSRGVQTVAPASGATFAVTATPATGSVWPNE